jgi:hypothetical protein
MADHIRKQVREAAKTALTGLATTGSNVFSGRISQLRDSEMPGLLVYLNFEDGQADASGTMRRDGQLRIEGVARGGDELIDLLDQIAAEVEVAIFGNAALAALLMAPPPDPPNTRIAIDEPAEGAAKRTGSVVVAFPIRYRTLMSDPTTLA